MSRRRALIDSQNSVICQRGLPHVCAPGRLAAPAPALGRPRARLATLLLRATRLPSKGRRGGLEGVACSCGTGAYKVTDERLTLRQAAARLGVSESAIRKRVERGTLPSDKGPDGRRYVYLDSGADNMSDRGADASTTHEPDALISELRTHNDTLREQVAYLQGVIATRDQELALRAEEIRRRDTALEREQQLAAMFADRLQALEAPSSEAASSSEARESPESSGPTDELGEVQEELAAEQARREMAESTLHKGMAEEQRRREGAERERDDLRRELYALRAPRESPETAEEQQGRGEPHSDAPGAPEAVQRRSLWRRIFGG